MWYGKALQVTLNVDLTQYHSALKVGAEGKLIPGLKCDVFGSSDRFGAVRFDGGPTMDIVLDNLTLHWSEEDVKAREQATAAEEEALHKTVRDIKMVRGPRGGWVRLSYTYVNPAGHTVHSSCHSKTSGKALLEKFEKWGVEIKYGAEEPSMSSSAAWAAKSTIDIDKFFP